MNVDSDFKPLVRHDTGVTLTYDESHQQYGSISGKKPDIEKNLPVEIEVDSSSRIPPEKGVLFFPGLSNNAYSVAPITQQSLKQHLSRALTDSTKSYAKKGLEKSETPSILKKRFIVTGEVIVAKLFLAGFFWQAAALLCGFEYDTFAYALSAGIGEATGVFLGNSLYDVFKKILVDDTIDLVATFQTSIFLATATICSGTAWQPVVNTLKSMDLSFWGVFFGTWICCTYAFNFGLRVGRNLYFKKFVHVEKPTWENSRTDFALALTIGGATAFFVGTDTSYPPEVNILYHVVGIFDDMTPIASAVAAGCSTALGFGFAQTIFNFVYPAGECWLD